MGSGDKSQQQQNVAQNQGQSNSGYQNFLNQQPNPQQTYQQGQAAAGQIGQNFQNQSNSGGINQSNANAITSIYGGPSFTTGNGSSGNNSPTAGYGTGLGSPYSGGPQIKTGPAGGTYYDFGTNADGTPVTGEQYAANQGQPRTNSQGGGIAPKPMGGVVPGNNASDPSSVRAWVIAQGQASGNQDVVNNPDYWVNNIMKVGGVGDGSYWADRISGGGGSSSGGGSGGMFGGMGTYSLGPSAFGSLGDSAVGGVNLIGSAASSNYNVPSGPSAYQNADTNFNVDTPGSSAWDNYKSGITPVNMGDSGYNDPTFGGAISGYGDLAKTGGIDSGKIDNAIGGFNQFTGSTGGFDPNAVSNLSGDANTLRNRNVNPSQIGGLNDIASNGGYDQSTVNNIIRPELLNEEQTGGYSAQDIQNIRNRAASSSPAYYQAVRDQMNRTRASSGNFAGANATDFATMRQAAQQQSADRLNSDIGIQQTVLSNKNAAANSLAGYYGNIAANSASNKIGALTSGGNLALGAAGEQRAGIESASNIDLGTQQAIAAQRQAALNSQLSGTLGQQQMAQTGKIAGLGGQVSTAATRANGLDSYRNLQLSQQVATDQANAARAQGQDAFGLNRGQLQLQTGSTKAGLNLQKASGLDAYTNAIAGLGLNQSEFNAGQNNAFNTSLNSARLGQAAQQDNYNLSRAGGLDSYSVAGGNLALGYAGMGQQYNLAQQAGQMNASQFLQSQSSGNTNTANNGLLGLYGSSYGPGNQLNNATLGGLNGQASSNIGYLGAGQNANNAPGFWDKYGRYIVGGAAAVGGAMVGGPAGAAAGYSIGSGIGANMGSGPGDTAGSYANNGNASDGSSGYNSGYTPDYGPSAGGPVLSNGDNYTAGPQLASSGMQPAINDPAFTGAPTTTGIPIGMPSGIAYGDDPNKLRDYYGVA